MAELSKTAKASMVREVKKTEVETSDQSIRKIRLALVSVPTEYIPAHRVKVLLAAYDVLLERFLLGSNAKPVVMVGDND